MPSILLGAGIHLMVASSILLTNAQAVRSAFESEAVISRSIYVNPKTGDDSRDGRSSKIKAASGPVKTIKRAVSLAGPGVTVHLAKALYSESIDLTNKSGEPGRPLIIDGHGSVIDGKRAINPSEWQMVSPGLYRNTTLFDEPLCRQEAWVWRWFFIFDGKENRMGRLSKGTSAPYKSPVDLNPGEWTYQENDNHSFYIKIDPAKDLSECRVEVPWEVNGVSVHGALHDLIIRNLTATHVINDGYNITPPAGKSLDNVRFENITAIECGDDGLSAHDDSTIEISGFTSIRNGTGICTTGNSVNNKLFIKDNYGFDVFFYPGTVQGSTRHVITNSFIDCSADNWFLVQGGSNAGDICTLEMDNVVIIGHPGIPAELRKIRIDDRARIEARRVTVRDMSFTIKGAGMKLTESVVAGGPECSIDVADGVNWRADRNLYSMGGMSIPPAKVRFTAETFSEYKSLTGQDNLSRWERIEPDLLLSGELKPSIGDQRIGADIRRIPKSTQQ